MKADKKTFAIVIVLLIIAVVIFIFFGKHGETIETKQLFYMDTSVRLSANEDNIHKYTDVIEKLDKSMSAYDSTSEISKLNDKGSLTVSENTAQLLCSAKKLSERYPQVNVTAGALTKLWNVTALDPEIPEQKDIESAKNTVKSENLCINGREIALKNNAQIDLGSCAKGYALDLLFEEFKKNNESYAVASFGSSTLLYGKKPDGKQFVTAVASPEEDHEQVLTFSSDQCFVSTSGGYERYFEADGKRYCHIIDLETGCPVESDLTSVTVISAKNGLLTDFLSTCIYIGGTEKLNEYLNNSDYQVIALDENKNIYCSDSIKSSIVITDGSYTIYEK